MTVKVNTSNNEMAFQGRLSFAWFVRFAQESIRSQNSMSTSIFRNIELQFSLCVCVHAKIFQTILALSCVKIQHISCRSTPPPYKYKQKQYVKLNFYRLFPHLRESLGKNVFCSSLFASSSEYTRKFFKPFWRHPAQKYSTTRFRR